MTATKTAMLFVTATTVFSIGTAMADAPFSWSGQYAGATLGAVKHDLRVTDLNCDWFCGSPEMGVMDVDGTGISVGAVYGYNWTINNFVVGVEANLDWTNVDKQTNYANGCYADGSDVHFKHGMDWLTSVRGRAGMVIANRTLGYVTAGYAYGKTNGSWIECNDQPDSWNDLGDSVGGWVYGLGAEYAITNAMMVKLEYLKYDFSDYSKTNPTAYTYNLGHQIQTARLGVNFKF
jgi:outer membrane immunogenic protein